jgi:hypothetical protein
MDFDVEELRRLEDLCIAKLSAKAKTLRQADPALNAGLARARACAAMPRVTGEYLWIVQRLQFAGLQPKTWK